MSEEALFANAKPGDEVAMRIGMSEGYHILKIKAVEEKRGILVLENGDRYKFDGTPAKKGDRWYRPSHIEPVTDAIRAVNRRLDLASQLNALGINAWKAMDLESLEIIMAQVKLAKNK